MRNWRLVGETPAHRCPSERREQPHDEPYGEGVTMFGAHPHCSDGVAAIVRGVDLLVLAETSLVDQSGASHRLGDLWQDQPIVLVFLRHFG